MCAQLQLLKKLLPEIERSVSDQVHAMPLNLEIILVCLKGCETDFNTLWLAVEPLRTERGIIWRDVLNKIAASIKWVVKTEEFGKFTRSLERAKQTLTLALLLAGVRVDNAMLDGLSSIETKLDTYGRTLNSDIHHVHRKIAFQLEQLEYRVQQKIGILSRAAAEAHRQNDLRITELYDVFTPNELLQTDQLSTVQSGFRDVTSAAFTSRTLQIDLVDFLLGNQQEDIANQALEHVIEALDCLLPGSQDAMRRWEVYANGTDDSRKIALGSSSSLLSNTLKGFEETIKEYSLFMGIFEKLFGNKPTLLSYLNLCRALITDTRIGRVLEDTKQQGEYFDIIREARREMQYAVETCTREYELYPEPRLNIMMSELLHKELFLMVMAFMALRERPRVLSPVLATHIMKDTMAEIRRSSLKVKEEVGYLHRRELRQAHLRLRGVDRKQDQVIRALDEQKKTLISMQEEQKTLNLINDHQKVIQMLQQLKLELL
ncbi:hypothetical protein HDV62DRAFT_252403 [Trichoderma sp. SZMC 28011]